MKERWRKGVVIDSCEPTGEVVAIGGRLIAEELVVLKNPADLERIKQGYLCPNCFEPFEIPYPVLCTLCYYPVRANSIVGSPAVGRST